MEGQYCNGALAHALEGRGRAAAGRGGKRTFACGRHPAYPLQSDGAAAHSVVGANCCGVARRAGVTMCLPAQINTNAPTRIVPASAVQPSGSRQSRCEVVVVLLFRSNAGARAGAVQRSSLRYVQLFRNYSENSACRVMLLAGGWLFLLLLWRT
jgi:hypothetical protein